MEKLVLALDQGTTSSRAMLVDRHGALVSMAQEEFEQILPSPGHVEHDPEAIWQSQLRTARAALERSGQPVTAVAAIGVTNQRETTLIWERDTGRPIGNAIVWQSRITAPICEWLRKEGTEQLFRERTGLLIDPYFSATKLKYLLDRDPDLRRRAGKGEILFGTVDSWLIYRLSGHQLHVTDTTNASRTLLMNIRTLDWDDELLRILDIPRAMLPRIVASSGVIGHTHADVLGASIPLAGIAGDQQAATFGQCCFAPGEAKNTYGTGCFLLLNTGNQPVFSNNRLLTTVAWTLGESTPDRATYCLEGSIFVGGAAVQWLRDGLGIIERSDEVSALAASVPDTGGVYFVPAFVGLGAPHWDSYARGLLIGITRGTQRAHIARAAVEAMAFQSRDLLTAMARDTQQQLSSLKVDGGATANDLLLQFQADIVGTPVLRPQVAETTALGAAFLAGLAVGYWHDLDELRDIWSLDREFTPQMSPSERDARHARWAEAVRRSLNWEPVEG